MMSEWCVQVDFRGLVFMLEHSPVLENLTLKFRKVYVLQMDSLQKLCSVKFLLCPLLRRLYTGGCGRRCWVDTVVWW
jgi:hypothetical protein